MIVGAWRLCREVELSAARARLVEIRWESEPPLATWHLPTSKADPQALGRARTRKTRIRRTQILACVFARKQASANSQPMALSPSLQHCLRRRWTSQAASSILAWCLDFLRDEKLGTPPAGRALYLACSSAEGRSRQVRRAREAQAESDRIPRFRGSLGLEVLYGEVR